MRCWIASRLGIPWPGHRIYVAARFGRGARMIRCRRCGRAWGMHDATQSVVAWDAELDEMYRRFGYGEVIDSALRFAS